MCIFLWQNGALWGMGMVDCGICGTGLYCRDRCDNLDQSIAISRISPDLKTSWDLTIRRIMRYGDHPSISITFYGPHTNLACLCKLNVKLDVVWHSRILFPRPYCHLLCEISKYDSLGIYAARLQWRLCSMCTLLICSWWRVSYLTS